MREQRVQRRTQPLYTHKISLQKRKAVARLPDYSAAARAATKTLGYLSEVEVSASVPTYAKTHIQRFKRAMSTKNYDVKHREDNEAVVMRLPQMPQLLFYIQNVI